MFDLLRGDWLTRLGPDAFLILRKTTTPINSQFLDEIHARLISEPCWPTRAKESGNTKASLLGVASAIVVPTNSGLATFMEDARYLDSHFQSNSAINDFIQQCGAKQFTLNSLIRLICAGPDKKVLKSRLADNEADFHWKIYPPPMFKTVDFQEKLGVALDSQEGLFTQENNYDLRHTKVLLSSANELVLSENLTWVIDNGIGRFCPVPAARLLHPALNKYRSFRTLCTEFNPTNWTLSVAERIEKSQVPDEERRALYTYLLSEQRRLSRDTIRLLRKVPIFLDHNGVWIAPQDITIRGASEANALRNVLHFPHAEYEGNERLTKLFAFRNKIDGNDLLAYAKYISGHPELALEAERVFTRQITLLTDSVVSNLRNIAFLQSKNGTLHRPTQIYVSNPLVRSCVGANAEFAAGNNSVFYERLRCLDKPMSVDIVSYLEERKTQPEESIYRYLVEAMRREDLPPNRYKDRLILWCTPGFSTPQNTLLGSYFRRVFMNILPQANVSGDLYKHYKILGAHSQIQFDHWNIFFDWFQSKYASNGGPLKPAEIDAMKGAYARLSESSYLDLLRRRFNPLSRCFLDRAGILHTKSDVDLLEIVIDDAPDLATACQEAGVPISFAASDENTLPFYESLGMKRLTDVRQVIAGGVLTNSEIPPPAFLDVDSMLETFKKLAFASAVAALSTHEASSRANAKLRRRGSDIERHLQGIEFITFSIDLSRNYRVKKKKVQVVVDHIIEKKAIPKVWWILAFKTAHLLPNPWLILVGLYSISVAV